MKPRTDKPGIQIAPERYSDEKYPEKELTEKIIGCAINVHRQLGPGYLEGIYENALAYELTKRGVNFDKYVAKVLYDGVTVGEHRVDLLVEGKVVVELKSVDVVVQKHLAQVISSLKAVGANVGLLVNFDEAKLVDGLHRLILTEH